MAESTNESDMVRELDLYLNKEIDQEKFSQ